MSRYFISGHLDLTPEEFRTHYVPLLERAVLDYPGLKGFVVGDARGADTMAQEWLSDHAAWFDVVVYHMFESPRNCVRDFYRVGGFTTDEERDAAMTAATIEDIAWVRPGREKSGTAKNLKRRIPRGG